MRAAHASRIMKLVAQTSSSRMRQDAPSSRASWMLAAWLVLPLASGELKHRVSLPACMQAGHGRLSQRHAHHHHQLYTPMRHSDWLPAPWRTQLAAWLLLLRASSS